ncbi:MAG: type IX secretion system membrane protein PorP/SprF [Mariniphaga sp.]|nr:type IX secretion system membrane protein PorP/SprF [Mariniphaga sp.]
MRSRIIYIILGLSFYSVKLVYSQDPHFSQFYSAPNILSPSLAGSSGGTRFVANYRNQWPGISKTYQTYAFAADTYLNMYKSGVGVVFVTDKAGTASLNTSYLGLQYSYRVKLGDYWQFVPGMQFTFGQKSLDRSKLIFPDGTGSGSYSGNLEYFSDTRANYLDMASSLFLFSPKFWIGLTADHLLRPSYSFIGERAFMPLKIVNFGGFNFWSERSRRVEQSRTASLCYRFKYQNGFKQLDIGAYWYSRFLEFGVWYRGFPIFKNQNVDNQFLDSDAVVLMVGVERGSFRISYSYDIQLSSLAAYGSGAHEISLMFEMGEIFGCGAKYFDCFAKRTGLRFNKEQPRNLRIF